MNELIDKLTNTKVGCYVGNDVLNHMTTNIKALNMLLAECEKYAAAHKLSFNPKKSVCECFANYMYDDSRALIKLCGKILQWKDTVRYLDLGYLRL